MGENCATPTRLMLRLPVMDSRVGGGAIGCATAVDIKLRLDSAKLSQIEPSLVYYIAHPVSG